MHLVFGYDYIMHFFAVSKDIHTKFILFLITIYIFLLTVVM